MGRTYDTVSFLSDYGTQDEFVGVVKSVIRSIAPGATVIDLTHEIPPHDLRTAGLALVRSAQYLAPGVILAVVDPGVGTERRAVAIEVAGGEGVFVGPDNGLLASAVAMTGGAERAVELTNPDYQLAAPGPTFAGRDVFGPAAAHLCNGVDLTDLGPEIDPISLRPGILPLSEVTPEGQVKAEVLWIDRFGNVQLNVDPDDIAFLGDRMHVRFGESDRAVRTGGLALVRSAQYLAPGVILAVVDPGVGTERRAVAIEVAGGAGVFVGPDNGLLASAVAMTGGAERAVELTNADYQLAAPGPTFAGRDVFAPAAAHLCNGVDLAELGPSIDPITLRPGILPLSETTADGVKAEVLWVDRFGNVQLNVDPDDIDFLGDRMHVRFGESDKAIRTGGRVSTYGDLKPGQLGIIVDSYGLVSLAFDRGSAADELKLRPGDAVSLQLLT
jgi:S-adenosylmethionine hydrolase